MADRRRSVLGEVSQSQVNVTNNKRLSLGAPRVKQPRQSLAKARQSYGGDRQSMDRQSMGRPSMGRPSMGRPSMGRPSMGRPSMGRPSMSARDSRQSGIGTGRRSSVASRRSSIHQHVTGKQDPRPIGQKEYTRESIRTVIQFCAGHGFNQPLSPKLLSAPSNKDFLKLFKFLYNKIDPNYEFKNKGEDEIPQLLKLLQYPFTINKSAIFSCGSPHNWPKLLGTLTWLVELVLYLQAVDIERCMFRETPSMGMEPGKDEASESQLFFNYLTGAYHAFLANSPELDTIVEEFQLQFEQRGEEVRMETASLQAAEQDLLAEIRQLEAEEAEFAKSQATIDNFVSDIEKFGKLIHDLNVHVEKNQKKLEVTQSELCDKKTQHEQLQADILRLQDIYDRQELSQTDVERIKNTQAKVDQDRRTVIQRKEEIDSQVWKCEMAIAKMLDKTDDLVHQYNTNVSSLGLQSLCQEAKVPTFMLSLNRHETNPNQILSPDAKAVLQPALSTLKDRATHAVHAQQEEELNVKERIDKIQELIAEKNEDIGIMERRLATMEAQYQQEKEAMSAEYEQQCAEIQRMESEAQKLRAQVTAADTASARQLDLAKQEAAELTQQHIQEKENFNQIIVEALEVVTIFKSDVQSQIEDLKEFVLQNRHTT